MPKQPRPPSSLNRPDTHPESDAEAKGAPSSSRVRGPKEPPTAYSLFVKDTAAAQSIPIYEASKLWKEASDTDRTKYNNQAAYFKAEFEAALANPKKRLARGTLPPKKPLTACNLFTAERRAQLQSQGVNMSYNQVCALWSGLSDAEKQVYAAKAVPLREQYDKNFAAFIAAGGIPVQRRKRDATLPKLPIRPFQLFTQDQKGKGLRLPAVSAIWKSLSAETKKVYFAKAAADYDIYKRQMKALGHEVQPYRGGYDEHDVHGPKNEVASGLTYVSGREEKDAKNEIENEISEAEQLVRSGDGEPQASPVHSHTLFNTATPAPAIVTDGLTDSVLKQAINSFLDVEEDCETTASDDIANLSQATFPFADMRPDLLEISHASITVPADLLSESDVSLHLQLESEVGPSYETQPLHERTADALNPIATPSVTPTALGAVTIPSSPSPSSGLKRQSEDTSEHLFKRVKTVLGLTSRGWFGFGSAAPSAEGS